MVVRGWRGHLIATGVGISLALGLAGCGGTEYRYVNNASEHLYFKLPSSWELYRLTAKEQEGRPEDLAGGIEPLWHLAFDASGTPSLDNVAEAAAAAPTGEAQVFAVSPSVADQISLSEVRSIPFGFDPLNAPESFQPNLELVDVQRLSNDGVEGTRVVANVKGDDGTWGTVDATTQLDLATGRVYVLTLRCQSQCFVDNRNAISEVASSWTVRK